MEPLGSLRMLTPTVAVWSGFSSHHKTDLGATALRTEKGWVWIDPLELTEAALGILLQTARPAAIILTSSNHERHAAVLRERFGVAVFASKETADSIECRIDGSVEETVEHGIQGIPIPGGAPGETALLHAASGTLVMGDALINLSETGFTFLPDKYCTDPARMRNSLKALLPLEFERITFAHGEPISQHARDRLAELLKDV